MSPHDVPSVDVDDGDLADLSRMEMIAGRLRYLTSGYADRRPGFGGMLVGRGEQVNSVSRTRCRNPDSRLLLSDSKYCRMGRRPNCLDILRYRHSQ